MITLYTTMLALRAYRQSLVDKGMSEEEIDALELKTIVKMVRGILLILVICILLYMVLDTEQFCIIHDIKQFFTEPGQYLEHNFRWLVK